MGGEACIRQTRIPVWLLISYRRQGASDAHILEGHPDDSSAVDLVNAFAYAEAHVDEIDRAILRTRRCINCGAYLCRFARYQDLPGNE